MFNLKTILIFIKLQLFNPSICFTLFDQKYDLICYLGCSCLWITITRYRIETITLSRNQLSSKLIQTNIYCFGGGKNIVPASLLSSNVSHIVSTIFINYTKLLTFTPSNPLMTHLEPHFDKRVCPQGLKSSLEFKCGCS